MKKLLLSIFTLFILAIQTAIAENIRFVQATDVHMSLGSEYSIKVLNAFIDSVNKEDNISFVAFTGDNIDVAREDSLRKFMQTVRRLKVPYYIVLGNHDVFKSQDMSRERYFSIIKEYNKSYLGRKSNYVFKKKGFVFLVVDGAKEIIPGPAGYYKEDTLAWVDKQLTKYKHKDVIILQHFPLEYPNTSKGRIKTHKTYKDDVYKEVLSKHDNVLAIISGHFHVNHEIMENGVYNIITPSLQALPHSYKIIDVVTSKEFSPIIYTQLKTFDVDI